MDDAPKEGKGLRPPPVNMGNPAKDNALGTLSVGVLAAIPAIAALLTFGILQTPDTPGYIAYAEQIRHGIPTGSALLAESPAPISLFRTPGYPAILALCQMLFASHWQIATVLLQIAAQSLVATACYRAALTFGARPLLAGLVALLPAIGFSVVVQIALLTDALYAAAATAAALALLRPGRRAALAAGLLLAAATLLREATPFITLFYLPLAARSGWLRAAMVMLGPLTVTAGLLAWNLERIDAPLLTTSRQTVMVQALLPLAAWGLSVFPGDDPFDRIARETVGAGDYQAIDTLHARLFHEAGMTAPEIATTATARYWTAWRSHPAAMLTTIVSRLRREFFQLPLQPVDTVGALMVYAGWPRPTFDRLDRLWAELRTGSTAAAFWIATDILTRLAGTAIAVAALIAPLLVRRGPCLGLWLVCAGFFAVYLPVHIETRYLVPVVPLACLMAGQAACRDPRWRASPLPR